MSTQTLFCEKENGKLNVKNTILTGFGFLASSVAWAIYDPYITKILNHLLSENAWVTQLSAKLNAAVPFLAKFAAAQGEDVNVGGGITLVPLFIGIIMTFDNIFGVIFQPTFGKISDRCHSKLGKRRPFIVFGAPICALLFTMIPFAALKLGSLSLTMLAIILFVFGMSLWRAPVVALMPDLTPPALRSEGNSIINLVGSAGSVIGMVAGTIVTFIYEMVTKTEITSTNEETIYPYVFILGAVVMVCGMLVVLIKVKEPDSRIRVQAESNMEMDAKAKAKAEKEARKAEKAKAKANKLSPERRRSLIFMLAGLFFLFCGTNAITTFFTLFAAEILHLTTSQTTLLMTMFGIVSGISAIPAGKIGKKLGRKKTILGGLALFIVAFAAFFMIFNVLIAKDGFNMSSYNQLNKQYVELNDQINEFNEEKELKKENALTMDGYVAYLEGTQQENLESYKAFDESVEFNFDNLAKIINTLTENNVTTKAESVAVLGDALAKIIGILEILIYPVLVLGGFASMNITVNTLPLVLDIGGVDQVGTFTGYYYTATFSGQIASPIAYGFVAMISGTYLSLFYYSPIMFVLSLLCILFVKHGEAVPQEIVDQIELENSD